MIKAIPIFVVVMSIVVPIVLARRPRPAKALRTMQVTMAVVVFVWAILCVYVYPRYVFPE